MITQCGVTTKISQIQTTKSNIDSGTAGGDCLSEGES